MFHFSLWSLEHLHLSPRNQPSRKDGVLQDGCHDGCGRPWCRDHPSTLRRWADGGQCYGTLGCLTQGGANGGCHTTVLLPVTWNFTIIYTPWVKKKVSSSKTQGLIGFRSLSERKLRALACTHNFIAWMIVQRTGSVTVSYYNTRVGKKCVGSFVFWTCMSEGQVVPVRR